MLAFVVSFLSLVPFFLYFVILSFSWLCSRVLFKHPLELNKVK